METLEQVKTDVAQKRAQEYLFNSLSEADREALLNYFAADYHEQAIEKNWDRLSEKAEIKFPLIVTQNLVGMTYEQGERQRVWYFGSGSVPPAFPSIPD